MILEGLSYRDSPMWHFYVEFDARKILAHRLEQKVYLARYGRQSVHEWGDRETFELDAYYRSMGELVKRENQTDTMKES